MKAAAFHPAAQDEFLAAAEYYEQQAEGLGLEFISAVAATRDHVCEFPESGTPFGPLLRRFLVRRFPYALIYRVEAERILVLAVAHLRRRPGHWRERG